MSVAVGVIGTGVMGGEHARIVSQETSGAHLAGVFDADRERAQSAAAGASVFSDPLSLISAREVEAVPRLIARCAEGRRPGQRPGRPRGGSTGRVERLISSN